MFKLDLEKAEESEIKLQTSIGSQKTMTNLHTILKSRNRDMTLPTKLWFFQKSCMDVRVGP